MEQAPKLKIKEAQNVIDSPSNREKILERLSIMTDDIMFVRKEIENESKNERKDEGRQEKIEKGLEEEMMANDNLEWE